ncbi:unnamed protein product, partial [Mesorhabditis spiculigera]
MANDYDYLFKVCILGDAAVGKSSMISQYVDRTFAEDQKSTIGIDYRVKSATVDGKVVKLQIWDTAGQERFRPFRTNHLRAADGIIVVYSITEKKSFDAIPGWLAEVKDVINGLRGARQVWNAKIPVEITVESEELLEPARPYYVMLPRCGYFTFIMPKVVQGFVKQGGDMISCMKSDDHKQLWNSLATNQFDAFWTVNRKLMECSDSQPFIWLPIRLHEHGKSFKQQTIAPLTAGHPTTLEEAVRCIDSTIDLDATKIICHDGAQKVRHVLIMDEVDGMSGNEDRAGISELMDIIKSTMIPIICICNDRSHPKMRSLVNYCFDVRFPRPRVEQVRSRMMTIAVQEKMRISKEELDELIELSNHDVRQCIYNLQMRKAQPDITIAQKDVTINPFEAARKLLSKSTDLKEKQEMFFVDYGIMPLFVFENYLQLTNKERT